MNRLWRAWSSFWFKPVPLLDLAIFRIIAAGGQTLGLLLHNPLKNDFPGLAEIPHMYEPMAVLRLLLKPVGAEWFPPLWFLAIVFWITVAAGALATLGVATNAALGILALGGIFLQAYAYSFGDFHHPEAIMAIALIFLSLSPAGEALSVSAWARRRRRPDLPVRTESEFAAWPLKMLVAMFGLVYFSAAYCKFVTAGLDWLNGHTLQFYLLQDGVRWDRPLGRWLAGQHVLAMLMSFGTLVFETGFILALFSRRLLWLCIPFGIGMHLGIWWLMKANFWEYIALYLALIPWSLLLGRFRRPALTQV